ncbi:HesA/MoeB/ThiF family protein [Falsirhodobacter sp. alg1]|uniref:HesA/MoeB/ThiF family protein n=1 Tax=Falsirhodobacter sp. alg1 TaxID=1472418 RepID=UPI000694CCBF|nr:HesA/MoeB/ThiF family protein [Falsirhodobacter sp. alg1]
MTPDALERYSRHMLLHDIGGAGQMRLLAAKVLVIGAGGLGSGLLPYLAAAGVGAITVFDGDVVDLSNLQRQIIHTTAAIGQNKAESAIAQLAALNPLPAYTACSHHFEDADAPLVAAHDLVIDGTDSVSTRYLLNALCVAADRPLLAASIAQWDGQIGLYHADGSACYRCVFPNPPKAGDAPTCAEAGVLGPLPGIIGTMMAAEAVKYLSGAGTPLRNRLFLFDALHMDARTISVTRKAGCPDCGTEPL